MNDDVLLKSYFDEIIYKNNDFVKLTPCRGGGKNLLGLYCITIIWFKKEHPIISKIPFINWMFFKRYSKDKMKSLKESNNE